MAKLGTLGNIITGNTPKTSEAENYSSNDIPFAKPSDISDCSITYLNTTEFYISEYARAKSRILPPNSVLVTCIGIIGKVAINQTECAFNQQINAIIPNTQKCSAKYLAYAIQSRKRTMQETANAAVVPIMNKSQFSDIDIYLPSLQEQERIVLLLDRISSLIDNHQAQLSKLDELVKSRFIELFGDAITNSKNLPTMPLGKACYLKAGITTSADEIFDYSAETPIPCYGGNGIRGYVKEATQKGEYPIIGRQGALCGNVQFATGEFHATEHAVLVKSLQRDNIVWLYYLLKYLDLYRYHTGAAQPGLSVKVLNTIDVPIAEKGLQDQFAAFAQQTDKLKSEVKQSLEKLETLKKSLMQEYFG